MLPSMTEDIIQYLREHSIDSRRRVTLHFSAEVDEFAFLLSKLKETLQHYYNVNHKHDSDNPREIAFGLMMKNTSTLVAGFELVLTGYMKEAPILFRSAIEGFAVAWDLAHNKSRFAVWKQGKKFESTVSISNLKKTLEPIGKMYGFLSSMYVHTGSLNSSPQMFFYDREYVFQFFGLLPHGKEDLSRGQIYFALLSAYICLQLTELVFHNYSSCLETIEYVSGTDTVRNIVSHRHQAFVDASMKYFHLVSQDPKTNL